MIVLEQLIVLFVKLRRFFTSALVPPPELTDSLKLKPMSSILNGRSPSPTKVFIPPPPLSPSLQLSSPPSTPKPQRVPADSVSTPVTPQATSHPSHSKALSISSSRRAPPSCSPGLARPNVDKVSGSVHREKKGGTAKASECSCTGHGGKQVEVNETLNGLFDSERCSE